MKKVKEMIGKKVIIRADRAGVFFGMLVEKKKDEVVLYNCRRLWYWDGANSISDLAIIGVTEPKNCKFTKKVDVICVSGIIEIIPCTNEAIESIEGVPEWTMKR